MSDDNTQNELSAELESEPTELDLLKQRATMMGVSFSNNIGIDTLRERIKAKMEEREPEEVEGAEPKEPQVNPLTGDKPTASGKTPSLRDYLLQRDTALIRVRIQCLDPKKKDLKGEIITVANDHLGTVRKFVPFGEATDEGFHIPMCIYKMMKERKFLQIKTFKNKQNGQVQVTEQWVREFALEVLDPLTPKELAHLAATQAAAGNIG
jgi:hypothetical protein